MQERSGIVPPSQRYLCRLSNASNAVKRFQTERPLAFIAVYPLTEKTSLPGDDVKIQRYAEQKVLKKLGWICVGLFCIFVAIILVVLITNPSAAKEAKDFLEKLKQNPPKLVE
jgi:hypothetical protein